MKDFFTAIENIINVVAQGGHRAVILIIIVNFALALVACWVIVRFLFNFIKEHNTAKDKLLSEKDQIIHSRTERLEELVEQYQKLAFQSLEKDNATITAINEVRNLILFRQSDKN